MQTQRKTTQFVGGYEGSVTRTVILSRMQVRPLCPLDISPKYARESGNNYAKSLLRFWEVHRMLREEPNESPGGESLEGVGKTPLTTGTIFTDHLFTSGWASLENARKARLPC